MNLRVEMRRGRCQDPAVEIAIGTALLLLVGTACVVGWVALARLRYGFYARRLGETVPRQGLTAALRYYSGIFGSMWLFAWWFFRARGRGGLLVAPDETSGVPVLCVHGFLTNGTCYWGLRRALARHGRSSVAVSMGRPYRPIDAYVPPLRTALEELARGAPGRSIDVVAHSMGGIVLRRALEMEPELGRNLRRIVTLGSPHQGTPVSGVLPSGWEVRQMGRGSEFIGRLSDFRSTAPQAEVTTVASALDLLVFPVAATRLPGARSLTLDGVAHSALISAEPAVSAVVELLGEPAVEF